MTTNAQLALIALLTVAVLAGQYAWLRVVAPRRARREAVRRFDALVALERSRWSER